MDTIKSAENSLKKLFGDSGVKDKVFLDGGSGSGFLVLLQGEWELV